MRNGRVQSLQEMLEFDSLTAHDPVPVIDLALDLAAILARLPPKLRVVAESLKSRTVASTGRVEKLSRATLQTRVRDLRAAFEKYKIQNR